MLNNNLSFKEKYQINFTCIWSTNVTYWRDGIFVSLKREGSCDGGDLEMFANFCLLSSSCIDFIFKSHSLAGEDIVLQQSWLWAKSQLSQSSLDALQFLDSTRGISHHWKENKPVETIGKLIGTKSQWQKKNTKVWSDLAERKIAIFEVSLRSVCVRDAGREWVINQSLSTQLIRLAATHTAKQRGDWNLQAAHEIWRVNERTSREGESGARAETKLFYGRMLSKFINIIMTALHQYYSVIIAAYVLARSLPH